MCSVFLVRKIAVQFLQKKKKNNENSFEMVSNPSLAMEEELS